MTSLVNVPKHFKEEIIPLLPKKSLQGIDISIITLLSYSRLNSKQNLGEFSLRHAACMFRTEAFTASCLVWEGDFLPAFSQVSEDEPHVDIPVGQQVLDGVAKHTPPIFTHSRTVRPVAAAQGVVIVTGTRCSVATCHAGSPAVPTARVS